MRLHEDSNIAYCTEKKGEKDIVNLQMYLLQNFQCNCYGTIFKRTFRSLMSLFGHVCYQSCHMVEGLVEVGDASQVTYLVVCCSRAEN